MWLLRCVQHLHAEGKVFHVMIDLSTTTHHPAIEEIVEVLCNKTQNTDRGFFRTEVAYFLGKLASCMRATIVTKDRGEVPVNIYALALANSGFGKGHSVNIVENDFMKGFRKRFMEDTLPVIAEQNLWVIGNERAVRNGTDPQEEFDKVSNEFRRAGAYPFTFDSGTPPAVKQLRHKLLLANCGSINLQIDEIGLNLIGSVEVLTLFLELYDQGAVKQKLTKNTVENLRAEEVEGKTPTNMLLFGTPAKLFDGGMTEDQFYSFLETGYARRCLFGHGQQDQRAFNTQSPEEIYKRLTEPTNNATVQKWAAKFHRLADPGMFGWKMAVEEDVAIQLLTYKAECDRAADAMAYHEEIKKAEVSHRYFKALKLAGAFAFVDESSEVEMDHLMQAILLVEESGKAFQSILFREKAHVKLGKYIATCGEEVTQHDLTTNLPFYKGNTGFKNDMMSLATAWGYKNNVIIKKNYIDGIEFFKGESLQATDLSKIQVAYSESWAYDYQAEEVPFEELWQLTQAEGPVHWINHRVKNGHRAEENVLSGFNLIVIDVDGGVSLDAVHDLLKDYKFLTYTTKRHTEEENRFRLILPTNFYLELDSEEYKEFLNGILAWLPFKTDEAANQRCKKWETFSGGTYHYNLEGETFDVLPFIPKTSKNEQFRKSFQELGSLDNLERWFAQKMASGNRNNQMIKYALALVDSGMDLISISKQVSSFNQKINNPLDQEEIDRTIMQTVAKKFQKAAA